VSEVFCSRPDRIWAARSLLYPGCQVFFRISTCPNWTHFLEIKYLGLL